MMIPRHSTLLLAATLALSALNGLAAAAEAKKTATPPEALQTLPGFKIELIRTADPETEGSWISIAKDPQGRLLLGAERKEPLTRVTIKDGQVASAEDMKIPLSETMGMLYAFDSLYINGRGKGPDGREIFGLWRCKSTYNDGHYDKVELLREWKGGGGDHGAHAILLAPDKKHLSIVCGNFVDIPEDVLATSPHRNYADDLVLPRAEDGNGFGAGRKPPGGFVMRMDPDGSHAELVASGERNTYDVAYNPDGELFGFDSDMEWDWGVPWYRPIRVFHAVSAADHGFREGSAKWPEYYPDSLPSSVTIGIGCPTGVVFGEGAKFPAKYQRAYYIEDWTYGRLIAVHLTPDGASYKGTWENFLAPKSLHTDTGKTPLNMTGVVIGDDGAMYFTIGGRHTVGALYRISYTGTESTAPADLHDKPGADARELRHALEALQSKPDPKTLDFAWAQLASRDRFIRYAARIAIERQPVEQWQARALSESNPVAGLTALLALARCGGWESQAEILKALAKFPIAQLPSEELKLDKLRVIEVALSRQGKPAANIAAPISAELNAIYPAQSVAMNRELCQTLLALGAPDALPKTIALLEAAPTQEEQLAYVVPLRTATEGWTPELRKRYFAWWPKKRDASMHPAYVLQWFTDAGRGYADGASYNNFLMKIRREALASVPPAELAALQVTLDGWIEPAPKPYKSKKQRVFVKDWKMEDIEPDLAQVGHGRNFGQAEDAFKSSQCLMCHRFGIEGGAVGPELTAVSSRYSRRDILESILEPSKVISEQYANTELTLKNGKTVFGRIVSETPEKIVVRPSMLAPDTQEVNVADIRSREVSKISPMPPALVDMLTKEEILDLLAYLESGGRADAPEFQK